MKWTLKKRLIKIGETVELSGDIHIISALLTAYDANNNITAIEILYLEQEK